MRGQLRSAARGAMASPFTQKGGSAGPAIETLDFSAETANPGWMGSTSLTQRAGRLSAYASYGYWVGYIKGSEALLTAFQSASATPAGMIEVSVDNGAFAAAALNGTRYTLFTGLPDTSHLVMIRISAAYGGNGNVPVTGTMITATGAPPSITVPSWWVQPADGSSNALSVAATVANVANFSPPRVKTSSGPAASNVPMVVVKGSFTRLYIAGHYTYCYVSIDGAAPTRYIAPRAGTASETRPQCNIISGLSGEHTYYVWGTANVAASSGHFAVGADSARSAAVATRKLVQYGDSITQGVGATTGGEVDTLRVAAALGLAGCTSGISGQTIAQILARIPADAANLGPTTNDIAILASGRNDVVGAAFMTAQNITDYTASINALLTAGYGTVICRGVLPETANSYANFNSGIESIVTGLADPRVVYVNPLSWLPGITWADGTHPNDNGYTVIAGYAQTAYAGLL